MSEPYTCWIILWKQKYVLEFYLIMPYWNNTGLWKTWIYLTYLHSQNIIKLTHCGLVMPYDDKDLGQQWLR